MSEERQKAPGVDFERRSALFLCAEADVSDRAPDLAHRLYALADRLDRLRPLSHKPDAFFEERDEIREALRREARALGARAPQANPRGRFETGAIRDGGRVVSVERRGRRDVRP
jgi:hypothetical protein